MRAIRYIFTVLASLTVGSAVFIAAIVMMMAISATVRSAPDITPRPGSPAPDFALQDMSGKTFRLSDFRGQPTVIVFWADWCPDCKAPIEDLNRLAAAGVNVVGINLMEDLERVESSVRRNGIRYPILMDTDGEVGRKFGVQAIPNVFVIDGSGVISHHGYEAPTKEQILTGSSDGQF